MKNEKPKLITTAIIMVVIIGVIFVFDQLLENFKQAKNPSITLYGQKEAPTKTTDPNIDLSALDFNGWSKQKNPSKFWLPKDDIVIVKNLKNSYYLNQTIYTESSDLVQKIQSLYNQNQIKNIIDSLKLQQFSQVDNLTGLIGDPSETIAPYYLSVYQKNDTYCIFQSVIECFEEKCSINSPQFGCFKTDLDKDFQIQSEYYQLIESNGIKNDYLSAINSVSQSNQKYTQIIMGSWVDGGYIYLDDKDQIICNSKACCDQSSKDLSPNIWGDWCINDYQTIETYQPVGL